jgi:hypothetical protein
MDLSGLSDHLKAVESKDSITLPWKGTEYVISPPGPARRLRCAALLAAVVQPAGDERDEALAAVLGEDTQEILVLGEDVSERLAADDVPIPVRSHLVTIALIAWVQGEAAAQRWIDASAAGEPGPKAPARSRASKTGTSTGAASTTKRRASTSGTKPRQSASRKAADKAPDGPSTGGTSSPAGISS